jgi:hypothetical protein
MGLYLASQQGMVRPVFVTGIGLVPVTRLVPTTLKEMGSKAILKALEYAGELVNARPSFPCFLFFFLGK